ncbi:hypothetical protein MSA03_10580 [Microbacterium saccharophilum]|nr:hypothetical protein MSA03_10580 [Microbacterium saccharophilum]
MRSYSSGLRPSAAYGCSFSGVATAFSTVSATGVLTRLGSKIRVPGMVSSYRRRSHPLPAMRLAGKGVRMRRLARAEAARSAPIPPRAWKRGQAAPPRAR